ncbi:MAG: mannosyltransferase [Piccolia ochrophora]|nr:MAG: mannosyltransferase [Piccolia ochrophora]
MPDRPAESDAVRATSARKRPMQKHSSPQPFLQPVKAFYCFLLPAVLAALYAPIQDCDETFNYWEPTHYLDHGFGLQTWEYSPEYAIRSWLYIALHAFVGRLCSLFPYTTKGKIHEFYFIRIALATICALCETHLYRVISRTFNPRVGMMFLLCLVFSPGMFHASAALLPSSFAMCANMLGMAAFMDWRGGLRTAQGIMWFGIGGVLGWPFAIALALPFLLEEGVLAVVSKTGIESTLWRILDGVVRSLIVLALGVCVDLFFYHSAEVVPFNIVWYNIFSGSRRGPEIFGTEPWHFYVRNLVLNFNVWFVLALLALPILLIQTLLGSGTTTLQSRLRSFVFLLPFNLWFAMFTLQPHKEERFMYPAYPALALNAAIALHAILAAFGNADPKQLVGRIPAKLKLAVVCFFVIGSIDLGVLRTLGIVTAYSAPIRVHKALQQPDIRVQSGFVCYGKEWYRFPSSYFLPDGLRAKFIKSGFDGLLPGEFSEAKTGFGFWPTWLIPSGMNDQNIEDPGKYTDPAHCTFLVDSYFQSHEASLLEPHYVKDTENWEQVSCDRFLDVGNTGTLGRMLWLPDSRFLPDNLRRKWGQYCLLRRKRAN